MRKASRHGPQGQGLLELLIAVSIIVSTTLTTFALLVGTSTISSASKAQILATNLAREGIEVARGIRDSNWLGIDAGDPAVPDWQAGLHDGIDVSGVPQFNTGTGTWTILFAGVTEGDLGSTPTKLYIKNSSGTFYQAIADPGAGYTATNYWRVLTLKKICWNMTAAVPQVSELPGVADLQDCQTAPGGGSGYEQVGVEVTSKIQWQDRTRIHHLELSEKLYNWKT